MQISAEAQLSTINLLSIIYYLHYSSYTTALSTGAACSANTNFRTDRVNVVSNVTHAVGKGTSLKAS